MPEGGEARNHEAEIEAVAKALMKRWIDQANAERYIGGPHISPMVEPEEYDIDDPPEGMWEQALGDAIAALDAVRRSPQSEDPQTRAHEAEMRKEHGMPPERNTEAGRDPGRTD